MASHGVPFILFDEDESENAAPYEEGTHFWRWSTLEKSPDRFTRKRLKSMSQEIRSLYEDRMHSRSAAESFLEAICAALQ